MKILLLLLLCVVTAFAVPAQNTKQKKPPKEATRYVLHGDGFTDDTDALNAWGRGEQVIYEGRVLNDVLQNGTFLITWKISFNRPNSTVRNNVFVRQYVGFYRWDLVDYGMTVRHYNNNIVNKTIFMQSWEYNRIVARNYYIGIW